MSAAELEPDAAAETYLYELDTPALELGAAWPAGVPVHADTVLVIIGSGRELIKRHVHKNGTIALYVKRRTGSV